MDDEEEDMSRPISQPWGTPFRGVKYEVRATQITAPTSQGHSHNNNNSEDTDAMPCGLRPQPRVPFHGGAGLRSHFPAQFEPTEDRGEGRIEEEEEEDEEEEEQEEGRGEEDGRMAERPEEQQAGASVEAQIGRRLREIGDQFQQDHVELFMRHQRQNLPAWMRLTVALFGFLFPREALFPRLRGEHR